MKRKCLAIGIILLFIGTTIIPTTAQNAEKTVSASKGTWLYVGGSGPGNYTRIQDAVDNAINNDTIFVYERSSPYKENIVINKSISILGENKNLTIIDGQNHGCIFTLLADAVSISNFTIQNAGFQGNDDLAGVLIYSNSNLIFRNIITSDTQNAYGIILVNSSNTLIASNIIQNNYHAGIQIRYGHNNSIQNNLMLNNSYGAVLIGGSSGNIISGNMIVDYLCIGLLESFDTIIMNNNFIVRGIALLLTNSGNNTISQNNFIRQWNKILFFLYNILCGISNCTIQKNHWDSNYWYQPRILPKFIITHMASENKRKGIRIEVDWHPAREPYDIPGLI